MSTFSDFFVIIISCVVRNFQGKVKHNELNKKKIKIYYN